MPSTASVSTDPQRILVRAPNWIGDCVMAMPAVQRIRERFPSAHIALLAKEKVLDLWKGNPHLSQLIPHSQLESVRDGKMTGILSGRPVLGPGVKQSQPSTAEAHSSDR